ncbi:MAG: ferredoxin [Tissierellia bacterium]|nr:ferredoxin [Tissierellia bacterium]
MKAVVDKDLCIGCGLCPSICPEVFSMDDDGLAIAIDEEIDESLIDSAKEAEESCPVDAITVE